MDLKLWVTGQSIDLFMDFRRRKGLPFPGGRWTSAPPVSRWEGGGIFMGVDFRRVGGGRALQIPRRLGRLGFGAATDGVDQGHR